MVYKQPKHFWTADSIGRIAARNVTKGPLIFDVIVQFVDKVNRAMMQAIFETFGLGIFAQSVYELLLRFIDWALSGVITYLPEEYTQRIADAVFYKVSYYSPAVQALISAANANRLG